jgi:hypothetical protein
MGNLTDLATVGTYILGKLFQMPDKDFYARFEICNPEIDNIVLRQQSLLILMSAGIIDVSDTDHFVLTNLGRECILDAIDQQLRILMHEFDSVG